MKRNQPNNLYIKFWRNNIFLNLTTSKNKLIFKCSCGYIKNIQQGNLISSLVYLIKLLKINTKLKGNYKLNLILEGAFNVSRIELVYNQLLAWNFFIVFMRVVDKSPHNGCRSKTKKTKLRERRYLG